MLSAIYCLRNEKSSFEYTIRMDEIQNDRHLKEDEPVTLSRLWGPKDYNLSAINKARLVYEDKTLERGEERYRYWFIFQY